MSRRTFSSVFAAALLAACGGGGGVDAMPVAPALEQAQAVAAVDRRCSHDAAGVDHGRGHKRCPEEARPHDDRVFFVDAAKLPFDALAMSGVETDRWWGVLGGAGYRIEVPRKWNGMLVMYAHGFRGNGAELTVSTPQLRRHWVERGYAWAASSYSANYYDVRAGVEDTNALARAFTRIAAQNGRWLGKPRKVYIAGQSMGGHVAGAAVEKETLRTANHRQRYDASLPMCGVMGDTELFDYFAAYQLAAQALAGVPAPSFPDTGWSPALFAQVQAAMFTTPFAPPFTDLLVPTLQGLALREVVKNLTGGERPIFPIGYSLEGLQATVWGTFGGDGTITGILTENVLDTRRIVYQLDADPSLTPQEQALNAAIIDIAPARGANRLRRDGLRWIPKVNGDFRVPVVTLHTLGDVFVPFHMEQTYRRRAESEGSARWLVQRAVRAPAHCDFTVAEQTAAFDALIAWEQRGIKPVGDDVLTPATLADPSYGCAFTNNAGGIDDSPTVIGTRAFMPPCPAAQ